MRKILFFIAVVATMIACGDKNNLHITGTVEEGLANGDSLHLVHIDAAGSVTTLASCAVENGAFELAASVKTPAMCNIVTYNKQGRVHRNIDIVAENASLAVTVLQDYARVSGSPLNDKLQSYNDSVALVRKLYKRYYEKKAQNPTLSDKAVEEADKVMAVTAVYHRNVVHRAIERNIDNVVGMHIIKTNFNILEPAIGLKYIEQLSADYKSDYLISYMRRYYIALSKYAIGNKYADFVSQDAAGGNLSLSDVVGRGKPVIVSIWASDSRRSLNELSLLNEFEKKNSGKVSVVCVSLDGNREQWLSALKQYAPAGLQLNDCRGWNSQVLTVYGIDKCPYYILIDKNGIINYRGLSCDELVNSAERLL